MATGSSKKRTSFCPLILRQEYRKLVFHPYDLCAGAIIILSSLLHLYLASIPWPPTNSDEATMGLMARDILYHGKLVVMYYGQDYMGTLQAYLGALFFSVFGQSVFALRFGVVLELTCFLVVMYVLSCLLYARLVGVIALVILSLGSPDKLYNHVFAGGGPNEVLLFGALLSLLAAHLALTAHAPTTHPYRRAASFALWGLLAGLALWSDPLVLPFVVLPGVLILIYCWRERKSLTPLLVALGFLIGFSPYLIFFATVPREQVTNRLVPFSAQLQLVHTLEKTPLIPLSTPEHTQQITQPISSTRQSSPDDQQTPPFAPLTLRLLGLIAVSLPAFSGGTTLCPIRADDAWPLSWHSSPQLLQCSAVHGVWGLGLILLWGCAVWFTMRWLRVYRRQTRQLSPVDETIQRQRTIQAARLMILAAAGLATLIYGVSTSPLLYPWSSARYLVALNIATPGLLIVSWEMLDLLKRRARFSQRLVAAVGIVTLVGVLIVLTQGTLTTLNLRGAMQQENARQAQLVAGLEHQGIQHFYTDYWTCNRLAFESQERLICAVLDDQLQPGLDRDWPYRAQVYGDPWAAFVLPNNSPMLKAFTQRIAGHEQTFTRSEIGRYIVYQPV